MYRQQSRDEEEHDARDEEHRLRSARRIKRRHGVHYGRSSDIDAALPSAPAQGDRNLGPPARKAEAEPERETEVRKWKGRARSGALPKPTNIIEPGGDPIGSRSSGLALRGSNPLGVLFDLGSCCAMVEQTPGTLLRSCDDNMPPSCGDRNRILATMLISAAKGGKRTRSLARRLQPRGNSAAAQAPTGQFGTTS